MAQPEQAIALDELERQFLAEFDFENEARALEEVRANIMPKYSNVIIPKPYMEYCNRDVLVMEYLPGIKLLDAVLEDYERIAKIMGLTLDDLGNQFSGKKPPPITFTTKMRLLGDQAWNGSRRALHSVAAFSYNSTLGWFTDPMKYPRHVNAKHLMDTLVQVHGREILLDGCFNGDPHPGNILLLDDGRIGLIDYGQVKRLTAEDRRNFAMCMIALAEDNKKRMLELAGRLGFRTEKNDPDVLYTTCQVMMNRDDPEVLGGMVSMECLFA